MKRSLLNCLVAAHVLLGAMTASAGVYSQGIYSAGTCHYSTHWLVDSPPLQLGFEEYSYSTDAAGYIIFFSPIRGKQPGDTYHDCTKIFLGSRSFSVPFPPSKIALIGIGTILTLGLLIACARSLKRAGKTLTSATPAV